MAFCIQCGSQVPENSKFCTSCGALIEPPKNPRESPESDPSAAEDRPAPAPQASPASEVPSTPEAPFTSEVPVASRAPKASEGQPGPPPRQEPYPAEDPRYPTLGTGAYFGMMFIFALPVIGFLVSLILAFAAKNRNLRNFSRAVLIWYIIGFVLSIVLAAVVYFILLPIVREFAASNGGFDSFFEDLFSKGNGGYGYSIRFPYISGK